MTENYLITKKKKYYWKDHFFGLLLFLLIAILTFVNYTPKNNAKNLCLILLILSLIIIVLILLNLFSVKNYCFTKNELIESSFIKNKKKVYNLDEIDGWTEKQYKGKFENWEEIIVYFKNGEKTKISSDYFENYFEIKNKIALIKNRDTQKEELIEKRINKKLAIAFFIISLLFFYWAYNALQVEYIKSNDIFVLKDKTSERIKLTRGKHKSIEIKLEMYPDLIFRISGNDAMKATHVEKLIEEIKVGDSIFVGINKSDYKQKLLKVDSLTFGDKYFFNENISVESVRSVKSDYLSLSDNNLSKSENKSWNFGWFFAFGIFFLLMSIFGWNKE
ncbi:hypothetical protein [Flavobacterium ginsenosidimutans]|uniref:Uncharacterized protein n=1 Tax=Flavobacterium ginsenosidimutans TaxID=687844 RepID=A0ABZ2Q6S7_9FLAO|nr:hypothetical protein [Flavobacterium ginsenosidimutans]KAF2328070.1 hypothetical protein DM444_19950 [Flavobacterium ginsenosidimutans]